MDDDDPPPEFTTWFAQAIDLATELDELTIREVDELGLLEVAVALSKWRDTLG